MPNITITPLGNNVTIAEQSKDITFTDLSTNVSFTPQVSTVEFTVPAAPSITFTTNGIVFSESNLTVNDTGGDGSLSLSGNTLTYTGPTNTNYREAFSAGTGITLTSGVIATTITQYTNALARQAIGALDLGGDGSFTYDNTTGTFSYTGPSAAQVRAHFSAGTGISLTDGAISINDSVATKTYADTAASNAVTSLIDSAPGTLNTLNELAAALNDDANFATTVTTAIGTKLNTTDFTSTADTWLGTKSTTNLAEGTNLYYTTARQNTDFDTRLATKSTTNLTEGTNQYFTQARARESISIVDNNGAGSFAYNNTTGVLTYTGPTNTEIRNAFSAGTGITITDGVVATTITQYTDTLARNAISVSDVGGDGSLSYSNGVITYTGPSASEVRAHFSAGTGITLTNGSIATTITQYTDADAQDAISVVDNGGDGSLSYNAGVISYTGPSASEVRAHFSAGTGITLTNGSIATTITQYTNTDAQSAISVVDNGGDGSLTYNSGVITYTGPSASEVRSHFSAGTGITITNGQVATTITQYTNTDAQGAISVVDNGGDGSLTYNAGVITYTGPSATEVRNHLSAGTGLTYTGGAFAVDSTIATKTYADNAATTAVAAVIDAAPATLNTLNELAAALNDDANFSTTIATSIGTKLNTADFTSTADTWLGTKSTTNLTEGTNLYYTTARQNTDFDTRLATKSTTNLAEGTNLYYTDARFDTRLGTKSTTNLAEGTNLYYTQGRFDTAFAAKEAQNLVFDNTISGLAATNTEEAINELQQLKVNVADLTAAVNLYPTTAASGITGYNLMVDSVSDANYNTTAVNVATGAITGSNQLVASFTSAPDILNGNPGYITVSVTGNIRKTSGNDSSFAFFYFTVSHRDAAGTETLLGTSNNTQEVNVAIYAQYNASATLQALSNFDDAGDRLVIKWYATKSGPNDPNYDIQVGGTTPTRIAVPVPINVIPLTQTAVEVPVDTTNFSGILSAADGNVQHALDTIDNIVLFSGDYDDLTNKPTIPSTTTDITEGTNLYFTDTRARDAISVNDISGDDSTISNGSLTYNNSTGVITYQGPTIDQIRAHFSAGTGITLTSGVIASSITQYTDTLARQSVSVSDTGGDGSLAYDNTTGVFTYTGPSATEVRAHFSAGTGITLTSGSIATTITQYTDALARSAISITDAGGDGSLAYDSGSGVITYTGPSATEVRAHFSAGTGITLSSGVIATTITQYTNADAQGAISVTDTGGDGSLSYSGGVITYTGPSASEVRAHFSAGTGITLTSGSIATTITQYTDALARGSVSAIDNGGDGSFSYNSTTGEFSYTGPSAADVRAHISAGSGITITSGAIAVDSTIATKTYADNAATTAVAAVIDAAPTTLDTLNELAAALGDDANFSTTVTTALGNKLNTTDFTTTANTWLGTKSTTDLAEGTNQYFTTARARNSVSAGTGIGYDSATGVISSTITQYTDTNARAAISVTDAGGDGSLTYSSGVITYTGPSASDVRAHFSAGTGITLTSGQIATTITQYTDTLARQSVSVSDTGGDGSLSYDNTSGVFTYTGPSAAQVRAHFSAGTGITLVDGVITNTVSDTNTTYSISAETATGGANLRLTDSNASLDEIKLAEGANITITRTDANTITIASTASGGGGGLEQTFLFMGA
jgi:hypothetical protein